MKKYGERNTIIKLLREDKELNLTLEEIGEIFDLSRQRVHQIVGNTGNKGSKLGEVDISRYTNQELADKLDLAYGTVYQYRDDAIHPFDDGFAGSLAVDEAYEITEFLEALGAKVEGKNIRKVGYHLLVNRLRVCIKVCREPNNSPSSRSKNDLYIYQGPRGRKDVDYFIFVAGQGEGKYHFIVPASLVENHVRIGITWPIDRKSKWEKYYDNWNQLLESSE